MKFVFLVFAKDLFGKFVFWLAAGSMAALVLEGTGVVSTSWIPSIIFVATLTPIIGSSISDLAGNYTWILTAPISRKAVFATHLSLNAFKLLLMALSLAIGFAIAHGIDTVAPYEIVKASHNIDSTSSNRDTIRLDFFGKSPIPYAILTVVILSGIIIIKPLPQVGGTSSFERHMTTHPHLYRWLPIGICSACILFRVSFPDSWFEKAFNYSTISIYLSFIFVHASTFQFRLPKVTRGRIIQSYMGVSALIIGMGLYFLTV